MGFFKKVGSKFGDLQEAMKKKQMQGLERAKEREAIAKQKDAIKLKQLNRQLAHEKVRAKLTKHKQTSGGSGIGMRAAKISQGAASILGMGQQMQPPAVKPAMKKTPAKKKDVVTVQYNPYKFN